MSEKEKPWPAPAKLNLFLRILGRRRDGMHRIQTVFQFLDLHDDLHFRPRRDNKIIRHPGDCGDDSIAPDDDLAVRAAILLQRVTAHPGGVDIRIAKRIPVASGLGGGSSCAATTLLALNAMWRLGLGTERLATIGLGLGADVPVFVRGHAAFAGGIGEVLQPLAPAEAHYAVLVPPCRVPTAQVYTAAKLTEARRPITIRDFQNGGDALGNDLEPVTCRLFPQVAAALAYLAQWGRARQSGSGGAVFVAARSASAARRIVQAAPAGFRAFAARGVNIHPLAACATGV